MDIVEKATILHYHRHRIASFGAGSVEALGWRGSTSQTRRFDVLASIGALRGASVLDVGCGHGDLKGYLDSVCDRFTYIGIDQMPEFIERANERYGALPDTFFYRTDFTVVEFPRVDYVIAFGALGYRSTDPEFHSRMIAKMFQASTRATAFNMLDDSVFPAHALLRGHDEQEVVARCRELTPHVRVVRGYLDDDFTVFLYREPRTEQS